MTPQILLLDDIAFSVDGRQRLEQVGVIKVTEGLAQQDLPRVVGEASALMFQLSTLLISDEVLEASSKLKVIGRIGIGMDQVDVAAANARGVCVVNAAGAQDAAVADHAFALILNLARNVIRGDAAVRNGRWSAPQMFMGQSLAGRTLGIVGFGAIGRQLAKRAIAFGMTTFAYDPYLSDDEINDTGALSADLDKILIASDYVSVHTPLTSETHHIIGAEQLSAMSSDAFLINTSRGSVIDEAALIDALRDKQIAGAGLDVFEEEPLSHESPLIEMDNVVLTPHIGGWTFEAQRKTQMSVIEDVARVLEGTDPINPVLV